MIPELPEAKQNALMNRLEHKSSSSKDRLTSSVTMATRKNTQTPKQICCNLACTFPTLRAFHFGSNSSPSISCLQALTYKPLTFHSDSRVTPELSPSSHKSLPSSSKRKGILPQLRSIPFILYSASSFFSFLI